jgi:hypothetical protein
MIFLSFGADEEYSFGFAFFDSVNRIDSFGVLFGFDDFLFFLSWGWFRWFGLLFFGHGKSYGDNKKISNQCSNFEFYRMALARIDQKYESVSYKPKGFCFFERFYLDFI